MKINIYGIIAVGDLICPLEERVDSRQLKYLQRKEFLDYDKKVQGNARILGFDELLESYQRLINLSEISQSLVDVSEKSQKDVRKIICQAYRVIYGTHLLQKERADLPYGLKVYQNPKIILDLSLTANPSEYSSCSELEVLLASPDTKLVKRVLKLFQQTAQIPFRFERTTFVDISGTDLREYSSVRQLVEIYKPEFVRDTVYRRLVGKRLRRREDKVFLEELKSDKKTKR